MPFFDRLRKAFQHGDVSTEDGAWPSIVFLLREPHLPTAEEAMQMAKVAWGAAGPVELVGSVHELGFVLQASELTFALHAAPVRYQVQGMTTLSAVPQQSWDQHTAWLSIDLPGKRTAKLRAEGSLAGAYAALMYFVYKYWSPNCLALYFPDEEVTVPSHGDFIESIRWCRRNGIDLQFLRDPNKA